VSACALLCLIRPLQAQVGTSAADSKVYVGVLEDDREELANWAPGPAKNRFVRLAFEKHGTEWTVVKTLNRPMQWTVAFAGKSLGEVKSRPNPAVSRSLVDAGTHTVLATDSSVPTVGLPAEAFADMGGPSKVRRPLVVVSEPNFRDPDGWRRTVPSIELIRIVRHSFRHEFPHVETCDEESSSQGEWRFPDSDIRPTSTYKSKQGTFLMQVQLKHGNCYVDDPNDPWADQWFFIGADRTPRRIGAFMDLLDAGDYDADGQSEVIFFLRQPEDTDGYILFYSNFRKRVALTWSYH
jgi:hypothetical protein